MFWSSSHYEVTAAQWLNPALKTPGRMSWLPLKAIFMGVFEKSLEVSWFGGLCPKPQNFCGRF